MLQFLYLRVSSRVHATLVASQAEIQVPHAGVPVNIENTFPVFDDPVRLTSEHKMVCIIL